MSSDEDEFRDFVIARSPELLRVAFLLTGDRGHAEDLLQTALMKPRGAGRTSSTGTPVTPTYAG